MKTCSAVALLVILFTAATVDAADRPKARDLYRQGLQSYNLGEFADALAKFKEAYRNFEDPIFLFNIAQCQRQMGTKQDAIYSYKAYLRESPSAPNREEVTSLIASLERAIKEDQSTKARPPGGLYGPGEEARASTRPSEPPPPLAPVETRPSAPPETRPVMAQTGEVVVVAEPEHRRTPVYKRWWLWTIVGVVVIGAAVGIGVGVATSGNHFPSATAPDGTFHF